MVNFMSKLAVVFFHKTIASLKGNSKMKDKLFKKILTQKYEKRISWLQNGGSTYTRVNMVQTAR